MIKLTATALIYHISPVLQVSENFQKRELILDDSWEKDGKSYPSFVLIEFTGEKMALLDSFVPGQRVTIEALISGREYQGRYYNTIRGLSIVPYQPHQTATYTIGQPPAQSVPGGYPQQAMYPPPPGGYQQGAYPPGSNPQQPAYSQPAYPQQQTYTQQGGYPQSPMPGTPQGGNLGPDGLPFR